MSQSRGMVRMAALRSSALSFAKPLRGRHPSWPQLISEEVKFDGRIPDPIPLLRPHYRAFNAPMDRSAPVPRICTLTSRLAPLGLPLASGAWFLQFHAKACVRLKPHEVT